MYDDFPFCFHAHFVCLRIIWLELDFHASLFRIIQENRIDSPSCKNKLTNNLKISEEIKVKSMFQLMFQVMRGLKAKKCLVFGLWKRATWYYQTHIKPIMGAVKVNHLEPKFLHTGIWSKFMKFFSWGCCFHLHSYLV